MRPTLAVTTTLILFLLVGVANAADSTLLAETGGFLVGNANRCGVAAERVQRAGNVIHDFIVSAAKDPSEAGDRGAGDDPGIALRPRRHE